MACASVGEPRALRSVGSDKLPRAFEVATRHQDLPRAAVAYSIAGTRKIIATGRIRKRPQIVSASIEFPTTISRTSFISPHS